MALALSHWRACASVRGSGRAPGLAFGVPTPLGVGSGTRVTGCVLGLGDALTLTVDFSAIGGDVVPGMAAAYTGVNAATSLRLEVTSPLQVAPLYALSDATLASRGVYTLFVLGESSRITSALRKER